MDQVIVFDKTFQERLQEYTDIFSEHEELLTSSQIKKVWSDILELSMDPNGWQAIWKISRLMCENLNISFPTVVLAYVENIDFESHSAIVEILAVQDDIHLPEKHRVPLIQLWPTKYQDKSLALNLKNTATALDNFRFFYNNLFMPWDMEEPDTSNWIQEHLEVRLRLFYDMKNGTIPRGTAEHLRALITEAKRLQSKKEQLEKKLPADTGDLYDTVDKNVQMLLEMHVRLLQIKSEFELLENPFTRNFLIKYQQDTVPGKDTITAPKFWIVYEEGAIEDYLKFLQQVKAYIPNNEICKFASNLSYVLDIMNSGDVVFLSPICHIIKHIGVLETGGILRGILGEKETRITSNSDDIMLDLSGIVTLENLTISVDFAQCGILVRRGKLTMINCKIISNNESSTRQGIIVLSGTHLELVGCTINGFCTAVVGNSGSDITLKNCEISHANTGLKIHDNCSVKAVHTTLRNCTEYGVCVETEKGPEQSKVGNFASLEIIPGITAEDLSGENNTKGDVLINRKAQIKPVEDLFSSPVILKKNKQFSDDGMDVISDDGSELNITVVEKENHQRNTSPLTI